MNNRVVQLLFILLLFPSNGYSFFTGVFPKQLKRECEFHWNEQSKNPLLIATVSIDIELKDKNGILEEKAYIYLNCRVVNRGHKMKMSSECTGIRIMGIDRKKLLSSYIFPINSDDVEIESGPKSDHLVLVWDKNSRFIITNNKSFEWDLVSRSSGRKYYGRTSCE